MTSMLKSNSDKPQPSWRSSTPRFGYRQHGRFATADPIHLEGETNSRSRPEKVHFVKPSPVAFRRGNSAVLTTLGGSQ